MRARPRVVIAVLATAVLAAGCASSTDPTSEVTTPQVVSSTPAPMASSTPAPMASSTPTSSPAPSALPAPISYGPAVFVTGWETCRVSAGPLEQAADGVTQLIREGGAVCSDNANDARVSGTVISTFLGDAWGPHAGDGAIVEWGDSRIERDGSITWVGSYRGVYTSGTGDMIVAWYEGSGEYEGLSYFQWVTPAPGEVEGGAEYVGLIFPGSPPPR